MVLKVWKAWLKQHLHNARWQPSICKYICWSWLQHVLHNQIPPYTGVSNRLVNTSFLDGKGHDMLDALTLSRTTCETKISRGRPVDRAKATNGLAYDRSTPRLCSYHLQLCSPWVSALYLINPSGSLDSQHCCESGLLCGRQKGATPETQPDKSDECLLFDPISQKHQTLAKVTNCRL